jgi:hypothetical protein
MKITIDVSPEQLTQLARLAAAPAIVPPALWRGRLPVPAALELTIARLAIDHLVASAAAGVSRPGSWERGWLEQAFGEWGE